MSSSSAHLSVCASSLILSAADVECAGYILGTESSALELTVPGLKGGRSGSSESAKCSLRQGFGSPSTPSEHRDSFVILRVPHRATFSHVSFRSYPRWKEVQELLEEATAEVAGKGAELLHFQTMHLGLSDFKKAVSSPLSLHDMRNASHATLGTPAIFVESGLIRC